MVRKLFCLLLIWVFFVPTGSAQTVKWLVKPDYDAISFLNTYVFKCKKDNSIQLFNMNGKLLLTADSITNYCEGNALVLKKSGKKYRITRIIDEYGEYTEVEGDFFANQYSFFSEGLVSVVDGTGKSGYLDDRGKLKIPCQYHFARPFIKGWASVEPAQQKPHTKTIYIDQQQHVLSINYRDHGNVVIGSSFNSSGKALVAYNGDDYVVIDTEGNIVDRYERREGVTPIRPYDFAFDENGEDVTQHALLDISYDDDENLAPSSLRGKMGYKKDKTWVVPPQFSEAEKFANGCAIVCINQKYGVVKRVEGSFFGKFEGEELNVAGGKEPEYTYRLTIPKSIDKSTLEVRIDNGNGKEKTVYPNKNGDYVFSPYIDAKAGECEMKAKVFSDGLLLREDSEKKAITQISLDITTPEAVSKKADEKDEFRIRCIITNNSNSSVDVSGSFSVDFEKGSKNAVKKNTFRCEIGPNRKSTVYAVLVVKDRGKAHVTVAVKVNEETMGTQSAELQLEPYDD